MMINANFWNERYQSNQTGWDLKGPSTPLKEYIDQIKNKNIRILIPGCGNAYEAEYLIEKGFTDITLIDIAEVLVKNLKEKFKNQPNIKIIKQDFFKLEGKFDLILEQTFFCALHPSLREMYIEKIAHLLSHKGKLVGVLFNKEFGNTTPPFGGTFNEYFSSFSKKLTIQKMENCYNSIKPRAGHELFISIKLKE